MTNNIFCNIDKIPNEKPADTETIVQDFLVDKLKLAQEYARLGAQSACTEWDQYQKLGSTEHKRLL